MPNRSSASTRSPKTAAKLAASVAGLLMAALALTGCSSTEYPEAGDCIKESATVTSDAPTLVDCKAKDAHSKVVAVDDDPPDNASQSSIQADLCAGQDGGEAFVKTETEKKKGKKGKRSKTVTENDWAACIVKS